MDSRHFSEQYAQPFIERYAALRAVSSIQAAEYFELLANERGEVLFHEDDLEKVITLQPDGSLALSVRIPATSAQGGTQAPAPF